MNRKDWIWVSAIFTAIVLVILLTAGADAAVYRQGSSGEQVKTIQTKLKRWGYYSGQVDGVWQQNSRRRALFSKGQRSYAGRHLRRADPEGAGDVFRQRRAKRLRRYRQPGQ